MSALPVSNAAALGAPQLRTRARPACLLCGGPGTLLHAAVADFSFGVPGSWSLRQCADTACGLVWQDPMVIAEDLGLAYRDYYTGSGGATAGALPAPSLGNAFYRLDRWLERLLGLRPERLRHADTYLDRAAPGTLLDVGCGDGAFAAAMRGRGWAVRGTEFDPVAAAEARRAHGLQVDVGELRALALPAASFDAITARHVIEHVGEPVQFLAECWRLLRPGGQLVLVTPNVASLGHRRFGARWRGLEQPRHLYLYDTVSMAALCRAAGIAPARVFATAQGATFVLRASVPASRRLLQRLRDAITIAALAWREVGDVRRGRPVGEELVLIAIKEGRP